VRDWRALQRRIVDCELCPRLRAHCAAVAREKRAAYRDEDYWGRPVPNLAPGMSDDPLGGDPRQARLLIVGLAPAAHGANRTGRMFTGDRSGDFLFEAMHHAGFANQPTGTHHGDGLELIDCVITAAAHCAPPANKPTRDELANCFGHLEATFDAMPRLAVVMCLGGIALDAMLRFARHRGWPVPRPRPKFGHGALIRLADDLPPLLCTYHPSQQNTFTGRLTMPMLVDVFDEARRLINADDRMTEFAGPYDH
jgi:uracil-DNA glycosylase family 4